MDEQPVGVESVGGAGDEREAVFAWLVAYGLVLVRFHDFAVDHLVAQPLPHHINVDVLTGFEGWEGVEHGGVDHAGVGSDDGVGAVAADGEGGAKHVACAVVEDVGCGGVVDGQIDADVGDADARHDAPGAWQVELCHVVGHVGVVCGGWASVCACGEEALVVVAGASELGVAFFGAEVGGVFAVGVGLAAELFVGGECGHDWVEQQERAEDQPDERDEVPGAFAVGLAHCSFSSSFRRASNHPATIKARASSASQMTLAPV